MPKKSNLQSNHHIGANKLAFVVICLLVVVSIWQLLATSSSVVASADSRAISLYRAEQLQVGDYVAELGTYNGYSLRWRVVAQDNNGTMLRTEYVLSGNGNDDAYNTRWAYAESNKTYKSNAVVNAQNVVYGEGDVSGRSQRTGSALQGFGSNAWFASDMRTLLNDGRINFGTAESSIVQTPDRKQQLSWVDVVAEYSDSQFEGPAKPQGITVARVTDFATAESQTGRPMYNTEKIYLNNGTTLSDLQEKDEKSPYYYATDKVFIAPSSKVMEADGKGIKNPMGGSYLVGVSTSGKNTASVWGAEPGGSGYNKPSSSKETDRWTGINTMQGYFLGSSFYTNGNASYKTRNTMASIYLRPDTVLRRGNVVGILGETGTYYSYTLANTSIETPEIEDKALVDGTYNSPYDQTINIATNEVETTITANNASDYGIAVNVNNDGTVRISGTPNAVGQVTFTVNTRNNNATNGTRTKTFTFTIDRAETTDPGSRPIINLPNVNQGTDTQEFKDALIGGWRWDGTNASAEFEPGSTNAVGGFYYNIDPTNRKDFGPVSIEITVDDNDQRVTPLPAADIIPTIFARVGQSIRATVLNGNKPQIDLDEWNARGDVEGTFSWSSQANIIPSTVAQQTLSLLSYILPDELGISYSAVQVPVTIVPVKGVGVDPYSLGHSIQENELQAVYNHTVSDKPDTSFEKPNQYDGMSVQEQLTSINLGYGYGYGYGYRLADPDHIFTQATQIGTDAGRQLSLIYNPDPANIDDFAFYPQNGDLDTTTGIDPLQALVYVNKGQAKIDQDIASGFEWSAVTDQKLSELNITLPQSYRFVYPETIFEYAGERSVLIEYAPDEANLKSAYTQGKITISTRDLEQGEIPTSPRLVIYGPGQTIGEIQHLLLPYTGWRFDQDVDFDQILDKVEQRSVAAVYNPDELKYNDATGLEIILDIRPILATPDPDELQAVKDKLERETLRIGDTIESINTWIAEYPNFRVGIPNGEQINEDKNYVFTKTEKIDLVLIYNDDEANKSDNTQNSVSKQVEKRKAKAASEISNKPEGLTIKVGEAIGTLTLPKEYKIVNPLQEFDKDGEYEFAVLYNENEAEWESTELTLTVKVTTPTSTVEAWFEQPWFFAVTAIVVAGIIFGVVFLVIKSNNKKKRPVPSSSSAHRTAVRPANYGNRTQMTPPTNTPQYPQTNYQHPQHPQHPQYPPNQLPPPNDPNDPRYRR